MNAIVEMVLSTVGELVKIGLEARANAQAAEAEVLARLKVVLAGSAARVDALLVQLDEARSAADRKIAEGASVESVMINPVLRPPAEGGG